MENPAHPEGSRNHRYEQEIHSSRRQDLPGAEVNVAKLALRIGAAVRCKDQCYVKLTRLVVDPQTKQVTNLIVEKGLLLKQERVLPLSMVERVTGQEICLRIVSDQLTRCAEYRKVGLRKAAPDSPAALSVAIATSSLDPASNPGAPVHRRCRHQGVAAGRAVLGQGAAVHNRHKVLGYLELVVVDNENIQITQLIVRMGTFFPGYVVIPREAIGDIEDQDILISLSEEELAELPRYKPKQAAEILAELHRRLNRRSPSPYQGVNATMEGGILRLFGSVRSKAVRRHAEDHARAIVGVMDVHNELTIHRDTRTEPLMAMHTDVAP
jgi:uncharacterized protein YrrD